MKTQITGFVLMTLAAVLSVFHGGYIALIPASTAFVAGMYFGTLLGRPKE